MPEAPKWPWRPPRVLVPRFTPRKSHTGLGRVACTIFKKIFVEPTGNGRARVEGERAHTVIIRY